MNELINIDWKKKKCITADLYFDTQCHNFGYSIMSQHWVLDNVLNMQVEASSTQRPELFDV